MAAEDEIMFKKKKLKKDSNVMMQTELDKHIFHTKDAWEDISAKAN